MINFSVVIPTSNSASFIIPCLDSVFKQRVQNLQVILVDNASGDNTVALVSKRYPQVKIMVNKNNFGAARARNQALDNSVGEWVLVLDCDVVLEENFFAALSDKIAWLPRRVGMLQPRILDITGRKIYSAGIRPSFLERFHDLGRGRPDGAGFDTDKYIFGACSAAALYRRRMLDEIKDRYGYFDERFFFLFEDADLSWRAQKKGWSCLYYPKVRCFHHGNSSATSGDLRQFLSFRNRQFMILKNQHPLLILLKLPLYLVYDLPRFMILAAKFRCNFPNFYFHDR
jgi:GT2 family glycosyltransferase